MYEYATIAWLPVDALPAKMQEFGRNGWQIEQVDHYVISTPQHFGLPTSEVYYDVILRRYLTDGMTQEGTELARTAGKLRQVKDALIRCVDPANNTHSTEIVRIIADIDKFLFEGSPDDM